jgi:hypothetical protein
MASPPGSAGGAAGEDISLNQQVIRTLRKLGRERRSGVLTCEGVEWTRRILFLEGGIVGARSSSDSERLGEVMVRHDHISEQHLKDASIFVRKGKRLGQCLVELRIIQEEDVDSYVRLQVLEICSSVVIQPPKRMSFVGKKDLVGEVSEPVHVLDVVMEAARRTPRIDSHIKRLLEDNRHLSLTADSIRLMETVSLKPYEAFVLSRISGSEPTRSVFALSPLSEEQTARSILGHLSVGILELRDDPSLHGLAVKA